MAPFCIPEYCGKFEPLLLLNGVTSESAEWLKERYPDLQHVNLQTSLTGNSDNLLPHASVLDDLLSVLQQPVCIQDPDCFVTDCTFYDDLAVSETEFAAGPFVKRPTAHDHVLPDTFFLVLNTSLFRRVSRDFGISAQIVQSLPSKAMNAARRLGYQPGQFTESFKDYFDTLQAFWIAAQAEGHSFRLISGAGESVFHIGGTSYLHTSDYELDHWDFWPLSVHYFNLRLLEIPMNARFRSSFPRLLQMYADADDLLRKYPEFRDGYRYRDAHRILDACVNSRLSITKSL